MTTYCTECGSPLQDDAAFCTNCGTPVAPENANSIAAEPTRQMPQAQTTQEMPQVQETQQIPAPDDVDQGEQSYAAETVQSSNQKPAIYGQAACNRAKPPQQEKSNTLLIAGIAIGVLALVVIALCVYFFAIAPQSNATSVRTTTNVSQSTAVSSSANLSASSSDKTYGTQLLAIYDSMAGLDTRIAECADDFNAYFTNSSKSVRQGYADTAKDVQDDVNKQISALRQLKNNVPNSYATETQHVDELLNDLLNRIKVINAAWSNSLSYSNPADHTAAIITPIEADKGENGNKYNVHFREYYPAWKFTVK